MSPETISAIIAVCGIAISAGTSWRTSKRTIDKEIEKMRLSWEREDLVSSDADFSKMAEAVACYISDSNADNQNIAIQRVSGVRINEHGEISQLLDELYFAVRSNDRNSSELALTKVVNKKRETKRHAETSSRNKPKE